MSASRSRIVIADSRYVAEDAAALVAVDYEERPAVADCRAALAPDAPPVMATRRTICSPNSYGVWRCRARLRPAPHGVAREIWQHRGGGHSIEAAATSPWHDRAATSALTLWSSTQTPHAALRAAPDMLGGTRTQLRVVTPEVGGGFGPKLVFYPEDAAVALAAMMLRRPVKWIEDRREHFVATTQERDQYWTWRSRSTPTARILGVRGTLIHDHGAYTARGINLP